MSMVGELVPVVMVPRYTGMVGAQDFVTVPLEVSDYTGASLVVWRGPLIGTNPTFTVYMETSLDNVNWITSPAGSDPGANTAALIAAPFSGRRWFRVRITLGGTAPGVTCWCAGHMELRV